MAQFPWQSPYCAFDNNPVYFTDPLGLAAEGEPEGDLKNPDKGSEHADNAGDICCPDKDLPEVTVSGSKNHKSYYDNGKGFIIESPLGSKPNGEYMGNVMPAGINRYNVLINKGNGLVHKYVQNQLISGWNSLWGTNYSSNKDYDPAEESFNNAALEFATEYAIGWGIGKAFNASKWLFSKLKNTGSLWGIVGIERGFVWEEMWGANLRHIKGYNVIDDFRKGTATSLKTLFLKTTGYKNNPQRVYNTIKKYVDDLYNFNGVNKGGVNTIGKINSKVIELAIPKGATQQQIEMIEKMIIYAQKKNIKLNVRVIK
jgi:hypothetical protein